MRFAFKSVALAAVALSTAGLPAASTGSAQAASAPGRRNITFMTHSYARLTPGKLYSPAEIRQLEAMAKAKAVKQTLASGHVNAAQTGVTPNAATPAGYGLVGRRLSNCHGKPKRCYVYDSDWVPIGEDICNPNCSLYSEYETQLHESTPGGIGKYWDLTMNVRHHAAHPDAKAYHYEYYCGINVSGGKDHLCAESHGASSSGDIENFSPPKTIRKFFENNSYSNIEFPMVAIGIAFKHVAGWDNNKLRGWDTCTSAKLSYMCNDSGNGN